MLTEIMQLKQKWNLYSILFFFVTQHNVMCAFVKGGFCLTKNQRKQRDENAKWFLEVYTPEVARLKRSINAIYKDNIKMLSRIADVRTKIDQYYAPIQRVIINSFLQIKQKLFFNTFLLMKTCHFHLKICRSKQLFGMT
jgi:hypothetical protein